MVSHKNLSEVNINHITYLCYDRYKKVDYERYRQHKLTFGQVDIHSPRIESYTLPRSFKIVLSF